jgi:hypothetical protein
MPGSSLENLLSSTGEKRPADRLLKLALSLNDSERRRAKWRVQQRQDTCHHRNMLPASRHQLRKQQQLVAALPQVSCSAKEIQTENGRSEAQKFLPALPSQEMLTEWSACTRESTSFLTRTYAMEDYKSPLMSEAWMFDKSEAVDSNTLPPVPQRRCMADFPTTHEWNASLIPVQEQKARMHGDKRTSNASDAASQEVLARFKRGCEDQEPLLNDLQRLQFFFKGGEEPASSHTLQFHQDLKNNFKKAASRVWSHLDPCPPDGAAQALNTTHESGKAQQLDSDLSSGGNCSKSKSRVSSAFRASVEMSVTTQDTCLSESRKLERELELSRLQECLEQEEQVLKFDCRSLLEKEQEQNSRFDAWSSGSRAIYSKLLPESVSSLYSEGLFRRGYNGDQKEVVSARPHKVLRLPALPVPQVHPFIIPEPGYEQATIANLAEDEQESRVSINEPQLPTAPTCRLAKSCRKEWKCTKEAGRAPSEEYITKMQVKKKAMELFGSTTRKEVSHIDASTQWEHLKKTGLFSRMVQY